MKRRKIVEFIFPSAVAWWENRQLMKEYKKKKFSGVVKNWEKQLAKCNVDEIPRVVDDIYNMEMQRKNDIETKATSLFEGIGFAASILSIALVFIGLRLASFLLLLPIVHFIISGLCSWSVSRVTKYYFFATSYGLEQDLRSIADKSLEEQKKYWMTQKLASTEMNSSLLLLKSNWLSAAYQHFFLGMLFVIPVLISIIYEIVRG